MFPEQYIIMISEDHVTLSYDAEIVIIFKKCDYIFDQINSALASKETF